MHAMNVIPFSTSIGSQIFSAKCSLQVDVPVAEKKLVDKVRERITNGKAGMSASAYDTAWVAMVPSREYSGKPSFPDCLEWIKENQNPNGSWGLDPGNPLLVKDSLSCTLACLLALRKWNTGSQHVQRGVEFMESNGWAATHEKQLPPVGFEIVFPDMINYAKQLDLTLPFNPTSLLPLLNLRDSELRKGNWEYVGEGVVGDDRRKWKKIIESHQRRNGSLFNSPATTAAAAIHTHDPKCFHYLLSLLQDSNGFVPTMYPIDIYARLCMIDTLERLGIDRYFGVELSSIFDGIYRSWQEREEEIFTDVTCQALAFRLLRMKGYHVSSDEMAEFVDEERFFNGVSMQHRGADTMLELYRASQIRINQDETILDKINAWTKQFLKRQLLNHSIRDQRLETQVEYDLKNFYGSLDRFQNRRTLDLYDPKSFLIAKTAYRVSAVYNEDFIHLAVQDFETSRAEYLKELEQMNKWYSDCRLDLLSKGRNACRESYILTAALIVDPHLSMARMTYAKIAILITVFDDLFDHYGSKEEAFNIIDLIKEWKPTGSYCYEEVDILFTALYHTINEIAAKAYAEQGFCSKQQLINLWVELLESAMREKDSLSRSNVTSLDEYLSFAPTTIGCKCCVMTSVHFLGVQLSEEIWTSEELSSLYKHGAVVCRLLNDLKTYEREREENTVNSMSVQMAGGSVSEEEAVAKVEEMIEHHRRKVMQVAYGGKGGSSSVPRECKELVWKTCKFAYCLYGHDGIDEFSSPRTFLRTLTP